MRNTFYTCIASFIFIVMFMTNSQAIYAQSGASAVLDSATLKGQLDYIHEKTRVYNDFRAIREDIFLKLKRNVIDTVMAERLHIEQLNSKLTERNFQIETLNTDLVRTKNERDQAIKNKDSLSFLGIQMNKTLYSTIMWLIILGLVVLSVTTIMLYRRSHQVTKQIKDELQTNQDEFDLYRKTSREKYEKLVVSHHNEIMKLKNS